MISPSVRTTDNHRVNSNWESVTLTNSDNQVRLNLSLLNNFIVSLLSTIILYIFVSLLKTWIRNDDEREEETTLIQI